MMGADAAAHVHFQHVADGSSLGAAYLAAAAVERDSIETAAKGESDATVTGSQTGPSTPEKASSTSKNGSS